MRPATASRPTCQFESQNPEQDPAICSLTFSSRRRDRTCTAHDSTLQPYCSRTNPPAWCADSWCYIDRANCAGTIYSRSVFFPGLYYSYFTCSETSNTFLSWFQGGGGSSDSGSGEAHTLDDLVGLMTNYAKSISNTLEDNFGEAQGVRFRPRPQNYSLADACHQTGRRPSAASPPRPPRSMGARADTPGARAAAADRRMLAGHIVPCRDC